MGPARDHAQEMARPARRELRKAAISEHTLLALQRQAGNAAVSRVLMQLRKPVANQGMTQLLAEPPSVQRWAVPNLTGYVPATYEVGGVSYKDNQWSTAVDQIAALWTEGNGILAKRKEAAADFCGPGGAAAAAEGSLTESLLEGALIGLLTVATDGIGLAVAGLLKKGAGAVAARVSADPEAVLSASEQVIEKAVDFAKDKTKEHVKEAMSKVTGTSLATPLATYQSTLDDSLDKDAETSKKTALQQLLNLPENSVSRWASAALIYDSLHATIEEAKRLQWNATSDAWFSMHTSSGTSRTKAVDYGIVSIMLSNGKYPMDRLTAKGAYLGGPGANEATVERYNERPLGEVRILKRIIMESGSLGHGIVDCGWEIDIDAEGNQIGFPKYLTRWGYAWLAAKHLGLRDLDNDSPEVKGEAGYENVSAAADAIWKELEGKTAKELGSSFSVTSMFSGTGAYPR